MKNNKIYLILALLCVWLPLFMGAWDKDKPSSSTSLRSSNPQILANWSALETAITQDHEFSTGGTNSGEHKQIKFNAPISTPANAANKLFIYGKDVGGKIELHIEDEDGNELQMSSAGNLFSSGGLTVTGASTFNGSATLGAGDDLIGSSTSDIIFNTNKFTVAGDTGNTVIAGTLGVTGKATLGDTSVATTQSAGDGSTQIATTAYVDAADIKCWGTVNSAGTFQGTGLNTTSAKTDTGDYTLTWGTDFADTHYAVSITPEINTGDRRSVIVVPATGTCTVTIIDGSGNPADGAFHFIAIGAQ